MATKRSTKQKARHGRLLTLGLVGLGGACAGSIAPSVEAPTASSASPVATASAIDSGARAMSSSSAGAVAVVPPVDPEAAERGSLIAFLAGEQVRVGAPLRRVLYTWTTEAQARTLRRDPRLLVRSSSPTKGPDFFQRVITALASRGDSLANVLLDARFRKARFAWPVAWPTLRGFPGESYGDRLVRVVLSATALVLELDRATSGLRVFDLAGREQPVSLALEQPARIAAVMFVNDVRAGEKLALDGLDTPAMYREVVLVNESAIESWELGTDAIHAEIERGHGLALRLLARAEKEPEAPALAAWLDTLPAAFRGQHDGSWHGHFGAALALGSPHYRPTPTDLRALADALAAVPKDEPAFSHKVNATFPPGPVRVMPRAPLPPVSLRRSNGTF